MRTASVTKVSAAERSTAVHSTAVSGTKVSAAVHSTARRRRSRSAGRRSMFTLVLAVMVTVFTMMCLSGFTRVSTGDNQPISVRPSRYYEVIRVKANDTLWDIASRCTSADTEAGAAAIKAAVQEIMQVNSMSCSRIYPGQQLAVPCSGEAA